ncbi:MAG: substrate-binding domain-containing protein [Phycisphaerales bacterium]|nr:substrate-binding domain-containing protein [Phycisphaerales bacterium]
MKIGLQRKGLMGAALAVLAGAAAVGLMGGAAEAPKKTYRIGVIAKSQSNPVFQAARTGALDAGEELSKKLGADVKVEWRTPVNEDAQQQAQYVEQLASQGFDGIAISASDANVLTAAVNSAIDRGVVVITFDSDIPASKRLAYYGINDEEAGKSVMRELSKAMGGKGGKIAILSGNQNATNLNARVKGVKDELATLKDKGFTLKDVYYTKETASDAAALVQQVQTANPDIVGWAMVGGWPLFTQNALDGVYEKATIVSVDHLPEQLNYVKNGQVAALIGQDCYGWGYQSVVMLVDKLNANKSPEKVINNFPLSVVTKANVGEYEGLWNKWLKKK